jgi:hypothetical protein
LSWVDERVTHSIHKLGLGYERCEDKSEISTKFMPSSTCKDEEETLKAKQIPYPPNPKPFFNLKRAQKQTTNHPCLILMMFTLACFVTVRVTWMSFTFGVREWRRGVWTMLETHIIMSSLIFCLIFLLMLHLLFLMDLTIAHMVLVHKRVALCLDTLVLTHVLIMVIVPLVGTVLPLEVPILTLSRVTLTIHVFPVVVHVPPTQIVKYMILW